MLVLASISPRRKQLLELGKWDFSVMAAPINECVQPGELPEDYVRRLAESKAHRTMSLVEQPFSEDCLIIAADTAVVDTNQRKVEEGAKNEPTHYEILGKPYDADEAERMLRQLRGRVHRVLTGLTVLRPYDGLAMNGISATDVPMRSYSDEEITAYISSGDPLDKAGAYAIQHVGFRPVDGLTGCYANVMGLPLCHLAQMLACFGVYPGTDLAQSCQEALSIACMVHDRVSYQSTRSDGR
jgi:septum formation protein